MVDILFTNLGLLDADAGRLIPGKQVLVRGTDITEVADGPVPADGAEVVDLGGRTLMPGLIDCHVHVTSTQVRFGLAPTRYVPHSLVTATAARVMRGMLMRGFTTVRDAGGADRGLKEAVALGLFSGPRLFVAGRAISQTGGHGDARERIDHAQPCACAHLFSGMSRIADGVPEVRRAARDEIRLGADQLKVMASGGVASPADPVHFLQYSVEELEALVDEAERAHTYVMAHAYTAAAVSRCVAAGVRTIEHGNLIDEATAALMAAKGAFLVPTLATFEALANHGREFGLPEASLVKLKDVREVGLRSLELARAAGVRMAYGTDLLGELHDFQADEFAIRGRALAPAELIRSATIVGAEVLRAEGRLGVIAPGAFADLLVVDGNPLQDLALLGGQGEHLAAIMQGGTWVKNTLASAAT